MSGLEKAIRNALAQSERDNADIRARIYQSARQALEAGLRKQAVSDTQVVEAQRQRLEAKIREIEFEERQRLAIARSRDDNAAPEPMPAMPPGQDNDAVSSPVTGRPGSDGNSGPAFGQVAAAPAVRAPSGDDHRRGGNGGSTDRPETFRDQAGGGDPGRAEPSRHEPRGDGAIASARLRQDPGFLQAGSRPAVASPGAGPAAGLTPGAVGAATSDAPARSMPGDPGSFGDFGVSRRGDDVDPHPRQDGEAVEQPRKRWWQRKQASAPDRTVRPPADPSSTVPGNAVPRLDVGAGRRPPRRKRRGWVSGLVLPLAVLALAAWGFWWAGTNGLIVMPDLSDTPVAGSGAGSSGFDPTRGFSEDWVEVFTPQGTQGIIPGSDANVEAVTASGGQAVRVTSQVPGPAGEVAIDVPVDLLRAMAGKTSTIAVTLQTAADRSVEVAVRCDFGSLGNCSRHRFRATQEKTDALFRVTFDRSLAPNRPGRIYLNSDVLGGRLPIYVFSIRIQPGQ